MRAFVFLHLPCILALGCGAVRSGTAHPPPATARALSQEDAGPAVALDPPDAGAIASPPPARAIHHVLVAGQSLAVGVSGGPPLTLTQPFGNLMFNTGVMAGGEDLETFQPLVEGDNIPGSKALVETMSSAFANLVSALAQENGEGHDLLVSVHGSGAKPYSKLKRGSKPYANGMAQVTAGRDIAKKLGRPYVVTAVAMVHGEADHAEKSTRYREDLLEWQADYEKDIQAITGQTSPVPMFQTQISSYTRMMKGTETSAIPSAQLAAHVASGGKIVLVGPKYHLAYSKDGVHLTNDGYRHMGEDYAKAYRRVVVDKKAWEPVRPLAVTRDGAVITVKFAVPAPPLALDTDLVSNPGNYGFEYTDASAASPSITRVELSGPDTVAITLSAVPTADDRHIRYAFTGIKGALSGPRTGARGNLRDSDPTPSRSRHPLFNWCVHFDEPVP